MSKGNSVLGKFSLGGMIERDQPVLGDFVSGIILSGTK
jgi:hypothetical protein